METVFSVDIDIDTVYIRSNIVKINTPEFTGWEYDEIQYGKDEYIEKITTQNKADIEYLSAMTGVEV